MNRGAIVLISITGPSGSGKGFITERIRENFPRLKVLTWVTTRQLRPGEQGLGNRQTVSTDDFFRLEERGELVLKQTLFGHQYAVRQRAIAAAVSEPLFTELHINTLISIDAVLFVPRISIAVVPINMEFLQRRLTEYRGTEETTDIRMRLDQARQETEKILYNKHLFLHTLVVSPNNESAVADKILSVIGTLLPKDN